MVQDIGYKKSLKNSQTFEELNRYFYRQLKKSIRVQLPVKILEVDHAKQHCDVEVLLKEMSDIGDINPPNIIPNVPIRYTNETSIAYVRTPVQVGDTGTVEFFDCSVAQWKVNGIVEYHYNENYHTFESSVYTSGFMAEKDVFELNDVENTAIEIGTKAGTFIMNVDKTTGNLSITAPVSSVTSPVITLNGAVTINGALVVTGTMTGQSNISTTGTINTTSTMSCSDITVNGKGVDSHVHTAGTPPGNTGAF